MKKDELASRDYPVQEDMRWQRRESVIQRIGEYVLIVIVILGACGLFSKGILSDGQAQSADGSVSIRYERFGRIDSNMNLRIRVAPQSGERFTVTLGSGALDDLQIQTLQPQPQQAITRDNTLQLTYASEAAEGHVIWLGIQPQAAGRVALSVHVNHQVPVKVSQWIYP